MLPSFPDESGRISTPRLNPSLGLHLAPINVIISDGPSPPCGGAIRNLGGGFPLRCFQRLSRPDIATRRCRGRDSRYTRGQFIPVLSSHSSPVTRSVDYIFIRPAISEVGMLAYYLCKPSA